MGRIIDAGKHTANWRRTVGWEARRQIGPMKPLSGALIVQVAFYMPRPKSHFTRQGDLRADAPPFHLTTPDATKLWRSTEDALTGILWTDDALIISQTVEKRYADAWPPGADIRVWNRK